MYIKKELQHIIKTSLLELNISTDESDIILTKKDNYYTTNIAISISRQLHKKPEEVGEILKSSLIHPLIDKIDLIYPGILNITINEKYLLNGIPKIIEQNINYGKSKIGKQRKINIMLSQINPCDKLTTNNLKNIIYGDNLSRLLKYNDYNVETEIYVQDTSLEEYGIKIKNNYLELCNSKILKDNNIESILYNSYKDTLINKDIKSFIEKGTTYNLDYIKKYLDKLRVNFDNYISEESLYNNSQVDNTLDLLNRKGYTYFDTDSLWLKTTLFNDKKDRKLIYNDGTYTNLLPKISYHLELFNKNYDGLIDIVDNNYDTLELTSSLRLLSQNISKLDIKVLNNNEEINYNELIEKYGINQIRYLFSQIDTIDYNKYISEINTPNDKLYVIEKCNSKIYQIFNNYHKKITKVNNFSTINNPTAYIIMNKLYEFVDVVTESCIKQNPSIISNYIYELVTLFNKYYNEEEIINEDETYTIERLNFILAIKIVLNNSLDLIGIIPRETF